MTLYNQLIARATVFILISLGTIACTDMGSFTTSARPGETIALGVGWRQYLDRDNITVTITDSAAAVFTYNAGDPNIRTVVNTYPDPLSNLVVGYETNQNIVGSETIWGLLIQGNVTSFDRDWSQKFIVLDLPAGLNAGSATLNVAIALDGGGVENVSPQTIEILGGVGTSAPNPFVNWEGLGVAAATLKSLERAKHFKVSFSGTTLPYAIQMDMTHDPDIDNGGVGRAYIANAGGNVKNIQWTDDGTNMRVILTPMRSQILDNWSDFKFYVAGEITGLVVNATSVQAFDINGNPVPDMDLPVLAYR